MSYNIFLLLYALFVCINIINILLFKQLSKGKSSPSVPAQPPVNKTPAPVSEWNQTPEPAAQPPPVSYVSESTTQAPQESFSYEEG